MLIVFFNTDGIIHKEYLHKGQNVNAEIYTAVLQRLHNTVCRYRPEKWHTSNWFFTTTIRLYTCLLKLIFGEAPHTLHTWDCSLSTFLCSHIWRKLWKVADSIVEEHQTKATIYRRLSHKVSSRGASINGNAAKLREGRAVLIFLRELWQCFS